MKKLYAICGSLGLMTALTAGNAHATTWLLSGATVTQVTVTENTSNSGTGQQLEIDVSGFSGQFCGSGGSHITITRATAPDLFDEWVRLAQSALLSGRLLKIGSSNGTDNTGTCYAWYLTVY